MFVYRRWRIYRTDSKESNHVFCRFLYKCLQLKLAVDYTVILIWFNDLNIFYHSLSRYDDLESRQTSKPQNRKPLFDVELYLTVHCAQTLCFNSLYLLLAWQNYWMLIGWEEYNYFINCTAVQLMIFPKQTKWHFKHKCEMKLPKRN
jgi:hypothetical protein